MAKFSQPPQRTGRGGGSAKARRSAARLAAVQALYQIELAATPTEVVIAEFVRSRLGMELDGETYVAGDPQLFADITRGVGARQAEIDRIAASALDARASFDRLELLIRAILRAGIFELLAHGEIHRGIVINDYVDIAHAFFSGREPGIINGVLDTLGRNLRPAAAEPGDGG
ncbi:MAG: transcription antitermination factor NusB [Azospirillum sp.]|nr:transcription antitermination factor NusB [Azospirillum sp.]